MAKNITYCIAGFYHFVKISNTTNLIEYLKRISIKFNLLGTILVATEGINGTISGKKEDITKFFNNLEEDKSFKGIEKKISFNKNPAFHRMKVRLKKEIVKMGRKNINPNNIVGEYISAKKWNDIIKDPDTILIDARNFYESSIGTFKGSIKPETKSFSEFPAWFDKNITKLTKNKKNIAMFCTGGIRCEKATSYAIEKGHKNVFHLKGGILNYLKKINIKDSLWIGECFIFDDRVSLKHQLFSGSYSMCHACRMPITEIDKKSELYIKGVSCHHCANEKSNESKKRYADRQKQMELATQRGEIHLGKKHKQ